MTAAEDIMFTCEDIRQFYYCKRKIYYRYVLKARAQPTYKMKKGLEKHLEYTSEENPRSENMFRNVRLESQELGLKGEIDLVQIEGDGAKIIELKYSKMRGHRMFDDHKAQLAAQAMLLEEVMGLKVKSIEVSDIIDNSRIEIRITGYHREMVSKALNEMRKIVLEEIFPDPPENRGKCVDCEYRRFCWGDLSDI
ncbi:MAG: CRISPR-associated protein Cas4 [Candidatus Njordarchaeum guaymaensis]